MKQNKAAANKLHDLVGAVCGLFVVIVLVVTIATSGLGACAGVSGAAIPSDAQTLYGTANGRNDSIKVKVVATEDAIYQIQVVENAETDYIGKPAMDYIPQVVYATQSLNVDALTGATISSEALKKAIGSALTSGGIDPYRFGGIRVITNVVSNKVETGTHVTVLTANDWAAQYPDVYASYMKNAENSEVIEYTEEFPMIKVLYEDYGFSKFYGSARGHYYDIEDVTSTGRPHALANCFTCKTPDLTAMVNEYGDSVYAMKFDDVMADINEAISCYNCHANNPPTLTVTHTYLTDAVGTDFENIDAATLSCAQCHVEYYFDPVTKATTLPHTDLDSMTPDAMLEYYNNLLVDGKPFADYTNPRTGVRQIKAQHPEFETFTAEGSQHRSDYTCADCHMGTEKAADGTTYKSHYLTSPLDNTALIASTCSSCHANLVGQIEELQAGVVARTEEVGSKLVDLTEKLAAAVQSGSYTEAQLDEIRSVARDAQWYWDYVFVENSNGAHNSVLTYDCLDKADALADRALAMF